MTLRIKEDGGVADSTATRMAASVCGILEGDRGGREMLAKQSPCF